MKPSPRPIEARIPASYDGEQLIDIKKELTDIRNSLLPLNLNEADTKLYLTGYLGENDLRLLVTNQEVVASIN